MDRPINRPTRRTNSGQTMSEYVLAGVLIAIVSIGALTFMMNDLASNMPALLDRIFGGTATSVGGGGSGGGQGTGGNGNTGGNGQGTGTGADTGTGSSDSGSGYTGDTSIPGGGLTGWANTETVCFSDGGCLEIPIVDASDLAETTGGMGGDITEAFAQVIEQIIQALIDSGEPVPSNLMSDLQQLANTGHMIADEQDNLGSAIESLCQQSSCTLDNANLDQFLPIQDSDGDGNPDSVTSFTTQYDALMAYFAANPDVIPQAYIDIINIEGAQIENLAEGTGWVDSATIGNVGSSSDVGGGTTEVNFVNSSELVDQSSDAICATSTAGGCYTETSNNGS